MPGKGKRRRLRNQQRAKEEKKNLLAGGGRSVLSTSLSITKMNQEKEVRYKKKKQLLFSLGLLTFFSIFCFLFLFVVAGACRNFRRA